MNRKLAAMLGAAALWPTAATAQDMGWSTIIPSVTGTDTLGIVLNRQVQRRAPAPQRALPSNRGMLAQAPGAPINAAALRYAPSKARRSANLAQFVKKTRAVDPAGAKDLETLFAGGDFIDKIGRTIAPLHLRVDDVADAYALWWIVAWQATRGTNGGADNATNAAVRAQAARALSAAPEFVGASDALKQELAESLLVQAVLIDAAIDQVKGDPARRRKVGAAVNQGARGMGLDLGTMELTPAGFVPASAGAAAPPRPAARQNGAAQSAAGPALPYGLAAWVAGGLGLGCVSLLRSRSQG